MMLLVKRERENFAARDKMIKKISFSLTKIILPNQVAKKTLTENAFLMKFLMENSFQ